jgi:hypothetical protein
MSALPQLVVSFGFMLVVTIVKAVISNWSSVLRPLSIP